MWPGHPPSASSRQQQLLHPVSGQPVVYPPSSQLPHPPGSVYINRPYDCAKERGGRLVPDHELIVIDYADPRDSGHYDSPHPLRDPIQVVDLSSREEVSITGQHPALYLHHPDQPPTHPIMSGQDRHYRDRQSYSDTSSLYSGSDTMHSLQSGHEEMDLSGLHESVVDSDEEDLAESIGSFTLRDAVRDCLEKDPADRTDEDIEILMEFTHTLEAFADMTQAVRNKMCAVMVFAVVDKAGTIVMNDKEELDSWSVIINGAVRVEGGTNMRSYTLSLGQGFGIKPTMAVEYHQGVMTTVVDDCQFVCITQADYYKILHEGEDALVKEEEEGDLVKVSEVRRVEDGSKHAKVLLRATPVKLVDQLVEDTSSADPNYIEDFLLCHRIFLDTSLEVVTQLLDWFDRPDLRDKVTRILLLWVNNHFTDFELDSEMMELLDSFETRLETAKMQGQLRMLNFACAAKARPRTVILTRSCREEDLEFTLTGGYNRGFGIFIESVVKTSTAAKKGLKRGDQILDVNGENFQHVMTLERAIDILKKQSLLQINVKSNFLAFKEVTSINGRKPAQSSGQRIILPPKNNEETGIENKMSKITLHPPNVNKHKNSTKGKMLGLLGGLLKKSSKILNPDDIDNAVLNGDYEDSYDLEDAIPEHSLKIFKADQTHRFLLVNKNTTAREVVMLSLKEFSITECSTNYALVEVLVDNGFVKQRRLADATVNLAQRIGLASRYYIKNISVSQQLVPEEISGELLREAHVSLLQLTAAETATQLMVEDFTVFRQIEQTEYVDWLFQAKSKFGTENLEKFSNLVNKETLWVVSEIVGESNISKRVRMVKHFLKIAKQCKEAQNFNSMFAIVSGLNHTAVSRLKQTWERVPEKYSKLLSDLNLIMDPSRNFSRYRNMIKSEAVKPPLIPIYPMVAKDLTFIDIGNKTKVEGLINFEKLRLVAKEIRSLTAMCSAPLRNVPDNIIAMNENEQPGKYATMKRKGGVRNAPDARRMYQEALMVRKVKSYLANVKIQSDEEVLHRMSVEVEPPLTKISMVSASTSSLRSGGKPPSPSPSRSSSISQVSEGKKSLASGKFGAASPERERKLLSLAEPGPQTKRVAKLSKSSYSIHSSVSSTSPGQSPVVMRRDGQGSKSHERSHSDTPPVPVGLTAESSSVASLPGLRRGSVSSQDSQEDRRSQGRAALELPPRGGCQPPPRPPDYQTAVRQRVARTQSRDSQRYSDDETQVSAV